LNPKAQIYKKDDTEDSVFRQSCLLYNKTRHKKGGHSIECPPFQT
jgi:hypothetical protein